MSAEERAKGARVNVPNVDLSKPDAVVKELFDSDDWVKDEFNKRFSVQVVAFAEEFAKAVARFPKFSDDCQHSIQSALVCGFIHGVLDDLLISMKLMLTGKLSAAGNLVRQASEGMCMAAMCAHMNTLTIGKKECIYWELVNEQDRASEGHLAPRQFLANWERLGLNFDGAAQLQKTVENYHQHSHAGVLAMAYRMDLGPNGRIYFGGHFDEEKVDGYAAEFAQRIQLCRLVAQTMDALWPNVRAIAELAKPSKPSHNTAQEPSHNGKTRN